MTDRPTDLTRWKISNGIISAMSHPIHCTHYYDSQSNLYPEISPALLSLKCALKLVQPRFMWNRSLPDSVVSAESVNSFKSRLVKCWSMHDFVYAYKAIPLAAGSYI